MTSGVSSDPRFAALAQNLQKSLGGTLRQEGGLWIHYLPNGVKTTLRPNREGGVTMENDFSGVNQSSPTTNALEMGRGSLNAPLIRRIPPRRTGSNRGKAKGVMYCLAVVGIIGLIAFTILNNNCWSSTNSSSNIIPVSPNAPGSKSGCQKYAYLRMSSGSLVVIAAIMACILKQRR